MKSQILQSIMSIPRNIEISSYDVLNRHYGGFNFIMDGVTFKVRTAKKTPKKSGYFTVLWVKDSSGGNIPYSFDDFPDILLVCIDDHDYKGLFVFPREVLMRHGIISQSIDSRKGKMAFRVYTPWNASLNNTALATLRWQEAYFHRVDEAVLKPLRLPDSD